MTPYLRPQDGDADKSEDLENTAANIINTIPLARATVVTTHRVLVAQICF